MSPGTDGGGCALINVKGDGYSLRVPLKGRFPRAPGNGSFWARALFLENAGTLGRARGYQRRGCPRVAAATEHPPPFI